MSKESPVNDFGLLIAFVLPGFTALWGIAQVSAPVRAWMGTPPADPPTVAGFLNITVASITAGLAVSTVRWLLIDSLHHRTGVRPPDWDFSALTRNVAAFALVVDHYYRYYQFYANMLVSLALVLAARWATVEPSAVGWPDAGLLALMAVFFLGSRDSLKRYYARGGQLMRTSRPGRVPRPPAVRRQGMR